MGKCRNSLRSDNDTFLSIFCEAQITSSQTGAGQRQIQKQRPTTVNRKLNSVGTDYFGVAFEVVFDFDFHPLLTLPIVQDRKWIKKASLFERSEFRSFPIFCLAQLGSRRPVAAWSPFFCCLFFGEAKKR
jgi:hypothetical protein